jgi:hypothetical protein
MNQQERDDLRAKHRPNRAGGVVCLHCVMTYPCDALQILDAWEAEARG